MIHWSLYPHLPVYIGYPHLSLLVQFPAERLGADCKLFILACSQEFLQFLNTLMADIYLKHHNDGFCNLQDRDSCLG